DRPPRSRESETTMPPRACGPRGADLRSGRREMSDRYGLQGRSVIVTGGATLIGQAVVRAFVDEGARVTIADIDVEGGERLAGALGDGAIFVETDVRSDDAC